MPGAATPEHSADHLAHEERRPREHAREEDAEPVRAADVRVGRQQLVERVLDAREHARRVARALGLAREDLGRMWHIRISSLNH